MPTRKFDPPPGDQTTSRLRLRLFAALLAVLQLAAPVTVAHADPAPAASNHVDHLDTADGPSCQTFHDEVYCLSCRVLFTPSLYTAVLPGLALPDHPLLADAMEDRDLLRDSPTLTRLNARAPPRI